MRNPSLSASANTFVGIAGWSIAPALAGYFGVGKNHLERYATRFNAVEINSSFYRHHRADTYRRWADSVPTDFRFTVKLSRRFTHELALILDDGARIELRNTLRDIGELGRRMGPLLVQLPPSLAFAPRAAKSFFAELRDSVVGPIAFEPRHPTWRSAAASALIRSQKLTLVRADPSPLFHWEDYRDLVASTSLTYARLHGTPVIYRSEYGENRLHRFAEDLVSARRGSGALWAILDNTALGHAIPDALKLFSILHRASNLLLPSERGEPPDVRHRIDSPRSTERNAHARTHLPPSRES